MLQDSPLFRPFPGHRNPEELSDMLRNDDISTFDVVFGAPDLSKSSPQPQNMHLLHVVPECGRIRFLANDVDNIGVTRGEFPAGTFRLAADLTVVRFERELPAALLDPCTGDFLPATLSGIHYELSTDELSDRIPDDLLVRLEPCQLSLSPRVFQVSRVDR
ncbi:MAG: hypothetical protein ACJAZO_004784 [Myxococcota bacterium]